MSARHTLRVCALYPDLMNIYADRGNLLVLERRCRWRGISFELAGSSVGDELDGSAHDLFYLGGGQDRDQRLCAADLLRQKAPGLRAAAERGAVVLGICGGYQLLGRSYELADGDALDGVALLDVRTVREPGARLIGNAAVELSPSDLASGADHATLAADARYGGLSRVLTGFENHGGRTYLGAGERPLGRVLAGHGNDGSSGLEGARRGNVIGTYLHGPLLPKNSWFADWLIAVALGVDERALDALDDTLERAAHESALRAAGV